MTADTTTDPIIDLIRGRFHQFVMRLDGVEVACVEVAVSPSGKHVEVWVDGLPRTRIEVAE